ncbi:Ribosomal small subunit pseudouridine synthase A [Candidatus Nanosynsacchari sp. TM7_G1_3_12Alb]|nr:Ribosomal small subunit pseudouridine synthase A [Candidatus Nanosynsacchari sp. TM7_G1_3_12Alb]
MPDQSSPRNAEKLLRLNKYLALQLGISRRQADNLISTGTVTINGETASLGAQISPNAVVEVSGKNVSANATAKIYIALNKPTGYVCSRRQQGNTPTIYSLLPPSLHHLKPVGRLDKDSSGLILLTNDGDFAHRMTHPSFHKTKIYKARLDQPLEPLHQQMISDFGVNLEDGRSQLTLERLGDSRRDWQITMSEGRNRQIRRTFAALGYTVAKLHRTDFGSYSLGSLKKGQWIEEKIT